MKKVALLLVVALTAAGCVSQDDRAARQDSAVKAAGRGLDVEAAEGIAVFPQLGHVEGINSAVFSPNGNTIASGSSDHTVKLWDIVTGRELFTGRHSNAVRSVAFSPDGKSIASGSADNTVKLWDAASGREIRTFSGHKLGLYSAVFSPDGKTILSGSWNAIKLWDPETGREIRTISRDLDGIYPWPLVQRLFFPPLARDL
ncbi:MAG: hypothetical protein LBG24_05475 [Treponema sp.]|nr:hypothetical protein [Treponema sp.]